MDSGVKVAIIAAVADNGVIGKNGDIPWHLASDLERFKKITLGHIVVCGRKTFESILRRLGKPLPKRLTIVLTRQKNYKAEGCQIAHSWSKAISLAKAVGKKRVFVIGGAEIYKIALPLADFLHLTRVHADIKGDAYFPPINKEKWKCIVRASVGRNKKNEHPATFEFLERKTCDEQKGETRFCKFRKCPL